jgi:hydroxymethylpyrimidine/phosphomethylpyrimidine kinase
MTFSAHDPSGASGIQADIETLGALHCHCAPIVTTLMAQDTLKVSGAYPCPESLLINQARMVLEDMPVAAFKIGMLGSESNAAAVHSILKDYPDIPIIVDATLITYEVQHYESARLLEALRQMIMPYAEIVLVNAQGAPLLAGNSDTLDACAHQIMEYGAEQVLVMGLQTRGSQHVHGFFGNFRLLETYQWPRFEGEFQGEGSTLSSAIAAFRAQGARPVAAVHEALEYTEQCLKCALRLGMGRYIPNRLFTVRKSFCAYDAATKKQS